MSEGSGQPEIELYVLSSRPYSKKVKAIFESRDLAYTAYDVASDEIYEEMRERTSGEESIPQIFIDGRHIGDYDDLVAKNISGELDEILDVEVEFTQKRPELTVIGAGPAGVNAALYAVRSGVDTLLIGTHMGGQTLGAGSVENFPGARSVEGAELMEAFWEQILNYHVSLRLGERVKKIESGDDFSQIRCEGDKEVKSKTTIIASGSRYRKLNIEGEKEFLDRGVHHCVVCNGHKYAGQRVAVVGGGNSGMEAALELAKLDCDVLLLDIHEELGGEEVLINKVKSSRRIDILYESSLDRLIGDEKLASARVKNLKDDTLQKIEVDAVFVKIGLVPNSNFVRDEVDLNEGGEIIIDEDNKTSQDNIWGAGDVTDVRDKQIVVAAAEGAKAALRVAEYLEE